MSRVPGLVLARARRKNALALACVALGLLAWVLFSHRSVAQTVPAPYDCRSADPTKWPPSSKPYFMVALDTSGSMNSTVAGAAPSCAGYPTTRLGHARCALSNMVKAYAGEVNFGLATFPVQMTKVGRQVRLPRSAGSQCRDGVQNGTETGIDCGGGCQPCTCRNGVMDGTETGVDCGGTCMPCTCSNGVQDGTETAVDCGGSCYSCQCADRTQNGNETGTDCGGPCVACTCTNGVQDGTETGVDCGGQCAPCTCTDGIKNGTETGVDCGGVCVGCDSGVACTSPTDCVSGLCTGGVCGAFTCPNNVSGTFARCTVGDLWTGTCTSTCGNYTGACGTAQTTTNQRGANVLVPLPADDYWDTPPTVVSNVPALLSWVDNQCGDCKELFSAGNTPLNGILRDMYRYLSSNWQAPAPGTNANAAPGGAPKFLTPLTGTERSCRAVNVILITDGGETCPTDNNAVQGQAAAAALLSGWTIGSDKWTAKTYVVDVGGATPAAGSTNIAIAGGTTATAALNEVAMSQALAAIIAGSVTAESCDNADNNCNGCIDEGSKLYCNRNKTARTLAYLNNIANTKTVADCCTWTTPAERNACNTAFTGSISAGNPQGNPWFLPCWDPTTSAAAPETAWLCSNPGETCDNNDNNCDQQVLTTATAPAPLFSSNVVDENQTKCGSPAHCPVAESCDGNDNNCDNITDNAAGSGVPYSICPNNCQSVPEICNGCDDDCDGVADDGLAYLGDGDATDGVGVADVACGFSPPANCAGVKHCGPSAQGTPVAVGGCIAGVTKPGASQYGACTSTPAATDVTCDNLDDNCNGVIDEGAPPTACTNGLPGLVYKDVNPLSTCVKGQQACHTATCVGWVGPSQEVCDGLDNDCDGLVDAADPDLTGVGAVCGSVQGLCTKGTTACVGGAVICTGGTQPQPEVCDGKDNNCNGATDEAPLNDSPAASGCWTNAGNTCTFVGAKNTVTWTPPAGATCATVGTLTAPCQTGALVCNGLTGWACQGGQGPAPETCNGLDDNCNGKIDSTDPTLTGVGAACAPPGTILGSACQGTTTCSGAVLSCTGGATPSPEICDGIDNDCDGLVDSADPDLVGVGGVCGSNQGVCKSGINACQAGKIVCSGEVKGTPEVCDGLDNNCDGAVDNNITDAPATAGCWALAGAACTYKNATWSAPAGGTCTGLGTLTSPCAAGTLVCAGTSKWVCQGGTVPAAEVCDGVDNNCNGTTDDGNPGGGAACGTAPSVLPCKKGTLTCTGGQLLCQGEIQPATELCDSIDNDCDGTVDDNITTGVGNACGSNSGICKKGITACVSGAIKCSGGTSAGVEVCNGLDDDCDGTVDNNLSDAPPTPGCWQLPGNTCTYKNASWSAPPKATCSGVGTLTTPCAAGTLTCGGTSGWFCQGGVPPQPESCDLKDNDCNGLVDDGNPGGGVSCGSSVGACKAGTQTCTAGVLVCGGGVSPSPEICDGIDNNCDGQIDEPANIIGLGQICGSNVGTCKAGVMVCDATTHKPVCQGEVKASPEICDGKDNDCNGSIDDTPTDAPSDPGCWQLAGNTCSFANVTWSAPPGATCTKVGSLTAPCGTGTLVCAGASKWACQGGTLPSAETCDNADNNCNGQVDDGNPGGGAACGTAPNVAPCKKGTVTCTSGQLVCAGEVRPSAEICDTIDNDCNGVVDDNISAGVGNACGSNSGICKKGVTACVSGSIQCSGGTQPGVETCNGLDDDCDGIVDDNLTDAPASPGCWQLPGSTCTFKNVSWSAPPNATCSGVGTLTAPCSAGTLTCGGTSGWFCVGGVPPSPEVCDNKDNNCNGQVDDGNPGGGVSCGSSVGACKAGIQTCTNGTLVCGGGVSPSPEICDGIDNNCDGQIDEPANIIGLGQICGSNVGTCKAGVTVCDAVTHKPICQGEVKASPEVCNGLDDDCNGSIDDKPTDAPTDPGCWQNAGTGCGFANVTWSAPSGATCTKAGTLTAPCATGTLVCAGASKWACQGGTLPAAEVCDSADNNCNGQIDEGNPGGGAQCGTSPNVAPCQKGTVTCTSGQLACVGEIRPSAEICDSIDNDCNGVVDDNISAGVGNACGSNSGVCKKGVTACVSGSIQCSGGTQPGVETCNGLDDDCDGIVDDNLTDAPASPGCWQLPGSTCTFKNVSWSAPPNATCSGVGTLTTPCATGTLTCGGTSGWFCVGGVPPTPETCDNKDNDCNGQVDDGNPGGGVSCGSSVGACKAGIQTCTNGTLVCGGGVLPSPEICDGIDNNCDGQIDEPANIIGLGQICGSNVGTCKAGITVCDTVTHKPVCQGEVKASPEVCNGKDDDCNGSIDDKPTDTPADPGCWQNPGTTCTFGSLTWDPPPGATCTKPGSLTAPCSAGALICKNGGWECTGGRLPAASEVCDNVDNDCNGKTDDGDPGGGAQCGQSGVGECKLGTIHCAGGQLLCQGEVPPSPELCDGKDNDCNGITDDNAPGSNVPCTGQCATGLTQCVGGALLCQTTVVASPEVCNGKDDDCNGLVDDGVLGDAPANPSCWNNPGTTCSFENVSWDPPPGGSCTDLAPLTAPCQMGRLRCDGTTGWSCIGGKLPATEICDGQDQNCNGVADDGDPGGGAACGIAVGTCTFGVQHCVNGQLACSGQGKTPEVCNGKDDDCDGVIDNGLPLGNACSPTYDTTLYPGDRTQGLCAKGKLECDPTGTGQFLCVGGQGPQPEVCNGFDDDCDGKIDEAGQAPDGIDGTADPNDKTTSPRHVSDACGSDVGECKKGKLACLAGQLQCQGDVRPQPELCDCKDNNCDGNVDEAPGTPAAGQPPAQPLCGTGTACVKDGTLCGCAPLCKTSEFPCPTGETCKLLPLSSDASQTSRYCVSSTTCDCTGKTVANECGPAGAVDSRGLALPVCECSGADCHGPCFTRQCGSGSACVPSGDFAGQCRPNTDCRFFPCPTGKACNSGACVDDPCDPNPCTATQVCKPNPTFDHSRCETSCATVTCSPTQKCADGACVSTGCTTACGTGQLCLPTGADGGGTCGPSHCVTTTGEPACNDGSYCDPLTGSCGNDPCQGVKCPSGQVCSAGECAIPTTTGTGGAGGTSGGGAAGTSGTAGTDTGGTGTGTGATDGGGNLTGAGGRTSGGVAGAAEPPSNEALGLATGGGGCRCDLPARGSSSSSALAFGALVVTVLTTRRRARREGGAR